MNNWSAGGLCRDGCASRSGRASRVAVESNAVDADGAAGTCAGSQLEGNLLGATALGVLDNGTARRTHIGVLAGLAALHLVDKLDVNFLGNGDLISVDGESIRFAA